MNTKSIMTPGDRVIKIRKMAGLSQQEFASQLGITQGALSHVETNRTKLSVDLVSAICTYYSINSEWLLFERGNMERGGISKAYASSLPYGQDDRILLIKEDAHADYPSRYNDDNYLTGLGSYRLPGFEKGNFRMFEISGDSMEPTLHPNDIVVVERVGKLSNISNNKVYVVITENGVLAKRVFLFENGHDVFVLKSDNDQYEDFTLRSKDIFELWEIKAKITREFLNTDPKQAHDITALEQRIKNLEDMFAKRMGTSSEGQGN